MENRLVVAKGERVGGRMEWEVGISRCKLLYIGWINSKVIMGNYPVINHNGKDYKYIGIIESLFSRN